MSGRRSKKNQKLGSSRRGNRGLRVNEEKDNEFDGPDEVHTTNPSDDTVLEAQFDHMPSLKTDNQTTALECSPRAESPIHKASDVEADLPERKRKIGSTRKKAGGFKDVRNLEPCDEVRTSEEFGEEQENQLNISTTEEEHTYQTKNEQQSQRSGSGGELGVAQNIMVTVSQSKETDAIHHQEISSYSQTSRLEAGSNMAMEQSTAQSNVVTMAKTDHETLLVSTVQKRKMGSTRRPLGGNREQNRENVEVEELFRNTTDDVWKAEVKSSEAEFSMLEEMMQTWDDVTRISPTNAPSHTESAFVSNQPLSSEITEELDVSVETETNNRSVACSVIDSTKPPSDRFGNHENLFPNKELVCFNLGLETDNHAEDFNVFQNVSDSPPTRSENFLEEVGGFSDTYQDVPNSRHNTSEDCGSVTLVETKEEPCRSDPNIIISSSKQDTEIDKLVVNVEEPLSSPCPLDVVTKYGNSEIPTNVLTAEVGSISETPESDITHAEPTKIESTPKMTDPWPDRHGLEDEEKETLMEAITSGQEMKMKELYTQSKRLDHKEENMNIQATDDFVDQEIQSDMQHGKTRKGLQKHSANETNVSDSSLSSANCNLANVSPVTEHLHNVNMNLSSLLPEDSKLSCGVMDETVVSSGLNDLIINNQVSHAIVPEAENQDIYVEIKQGNDIDVIERSITCDVTVTENEMDVENFTEQSVDPQTLATRENENVGTKTGPETDALEIKDQDNAENNAKDDMIMQIPKNDRENEDEGDTKDREKQPGSQIQGRPSRVDPDKESYDFFQDTSVENAEESLLNAKSESAFDREGKTCEKYKMIEESGGHEKMDASAVTILGVTEPLANIPDYDIRSDLQPEEHSSHINFEGLMQDAVTESSLESSAVPEQTEISIIPEDSQGVQKKEGASEGVAENDRGLEFQEQNNVMDQNIKQTMMVLKGDEHEMTEKVRRSTQELCDDEADKAEGPSEITSEQQQRSSLNISQKQDGPPHDDSENMLESEAEEKFLRANTIHATFERMIETNDESKEIEEVFTETEAAEHLINVNIQDNAHQSDLQTENPEQNKVLTEEQNNTSTHINLEELQESEHAKNVTDVTDSFEDSGESYKELENINEIPEDSQKLEKQSKIKPLVHKRKMRGNKRQRKDREQDDDSETLNNEEKEQEREISGGKDTGPVEELDSTIIQSSCNAEKSTEESICDTAESQTTTKCYAESQETAGDVESLPAGGGTEAHLEIQTDIQMFYSTIVEGTEENICDDDVLVRHVEFVEDTVTVETNMTIESDLLQNNTSLDTNQETLKSFENAQNISAVTDTANAEEKEDGGSEGVVEEDTDLHSETQEQNNVIDDNIIQTINVSDNEEHEMTERVRKSTQELCDDAVDKAEGHAEITSEQQLRSSSNVCQTQEGSPQDESENIQKSEMDVREEKETENNDEEIIAFEDISSEVTVTTQAQNQLFIQTTDADSHDHIQTVKDVHEESQGEEMFLSANANLTIQDNDSQSDLQTEISKQNKVLTDDQNTNTTPQEDSQETEPNVLAVTDSGFSFGDSGESHKELENINDIPEDSQKEEKQSKIKPLVHKRKMGSTRRPLKGNKGQRKDREQDDDSETLYNEEKEEEREISGGKATGPVEELDSTIIQSSYDAEKSTEESICDITESQTTTKCHAESQENTGDVESLPTGRDTEAHLEIQTDINMFDSTMNKEGTEENICDDDVLMRQVVFVGDTVTVESDGTIESDLLQNNTSLDTHQEALKSSENVENVSAVTDSGLLQQDVVLVGSGETEPVSEEPEISNTSENSQRDSPSTLNLLAHKRKMGSTRRPLRGNKGQRKDREQDGENETFNSESLITEEKSPEESICDITESQTTTKCYAESQETAGDVASLPVGGDTEAHLEIQTDINMFDSTIIEEGTEENICDDNVLMRHVEFVGDTFTVETDMTIESDLLQNNTSLDTNQQALKSFENAQNVSAVTDTSLPLNDVVLVGSGEKTEMSIISDNSQGDSPSKLNPLAHKRKMGSTRRPLRGNREKRNNAEEKEDGGSEGVVEEDTDLHSETQEQNNVIDDNIIQGINASDNEEHERTETVRKSTQELCDDAVDKAEGHAEITSEQQLRSSSNVCQTQDGSPQDESENILKSEMDVREEKEKNDEEIFGFEDISSEVTVTPQAQNQLFIQTTDADSHDFIQTVKDVHEESQGEEMFHSANTNLTIQDNDSQSDLQTEISKQNKVLTDDQNTNTTPQEESQETEPNVCAVTDSGLSFRGSGESHKELENINDIPEDSQKVQSKLIPLVHKRKMGSTRRPPGGNKGQRKDREWHAEFQKNSGDVASLPVGGDSAAHLEFQTEIKTFDPTVEEGTKDNICDDDALMTQDEFVGDKLTVESNMTIESNFLQNITSLDTNQEALKSSENVENISTLIHSGLVLQDVATESSLESNTVPEKSESSIIPEDSHVEDSHSKLNPVVHKRKMGSTRRPLRGNKDKEDLREVKGEDMDPHSEIQEQNDVVDHDTVQKIMDVRHNKEENSILRLPVQELCEHLSENKEWHSDITLEQEQTSSSNISQTQTAPSQDDACENLPEIQESNTLVLSEALLMEENQMHVSEPVVTVGTPQIEDGKIQSVFSRSVQKRKMGSTRKTQRGQRMQKERELGEELDGETKIATTKEDTIKPQENFILEEVMSLTITGTHVHQQPSSLPTNKEGHVIENNGSRMNNLTENPEQNEMQMQNDPNSNTNPHQNQDKSEILISERSHTDNIHSNMNPTAQKRKMGSTRKTLRGNGRRTREIEAKEIDGDSERTSEEHSTEFATIERAPETKLDEITQLKETRSTESLTHPVATSKIFFETEDGVKKVSTNIVGLSVVSEEIRSNEALSEAFCTDLQSEMLVSADEMKVGEKYDGPSGLENLDKSKSPEEVENKPQLQLTVLDQSHQVHSEKHPRSENVTPERKRKMGSTRKNLRGKREEKRSEESESNQFAPEEDQDGETSMIREAEPDQIIHNSFEESDSSLLSEIESALRKTSPSSQNTDYQLIVNEPNLAKTPETSHFNTPENSEPEQGSDKEKYVSLQVTESQNQSEIGSPRRRRKMGSTRKNPRQQLQAKREDENEEDETEEKNKQESKGLKKDLEAAEESKMHDSRDNAENKEYLDVPVALTNSCQTEESTNSAGQEGTSPSTKRKFGSRRTNVGRRDLGGMIPPESNVDLTEDNGAQLVSLDQMIKASQHDGQTAGLKNISDMEVVQFNVVIVGNSSVGKTSFVRRFHGGEFSLDYSSTIGVDTFVQNIVLHDRVVKLQIWDTAGQERFHSITTQVFHRADGLLLMYEVTSWKSFISVRDWISQIQEKAPDDVIVMLLGNKNDCAGREVQVQEGEDLAREYKINFMECSAATGANVSECMKSLAEMLMQRKRQKMEKHTALKIVQPQKKSGCC